MTEDQKSREEFGEWRVGEFISSANRPAHVLMLAVGEKQIAEYGAHRDFIRWVDEQASRSTYRASVLEEALEACEALRERDHDEAWQDGIGDCKDAIRALAEKPQEGQEP